MNSDRVRLLVAVLVSILAHGVLASFSGFAAGRTATSDRMRPVALTIASGAQIRPAQTQTEAVLRPQERRAPPKKTNTKKASVAKTEIVDPDATLTQRPQQSQSTTNAPNEASNSEPDDPEPTTIPEDTATYTIADAAPAASKQATTDNDRSGTNDRLAPTARPDITAVPLYHLIPKPKYPSRARDLGEEGIVIIAVYVGDDGTVLDAYVSESSGYLLLDGSALTTVLERWRFKPGMRGGKAVPSWVRVPIKFNIKGR